MDKLVSTRRAFVKAVGAIGLAAAGPASAARRKAPVHSLDPLVAMPATALAKAIATRQASCADVMSAVLRQIAAHNPAVNAIVALRDHDALLAEARAMDKRLATGEAVGPLAGLPIAVKDLMDVVGIRSTMGSLVLRDHVPAAEGIMVERLRRAGAILIGKTNTPEFGFGSHTYNRVYGATRNAWDRGRSAGGSSGGAAVSVALRLLPIADGSDFGGSLRNPAAWNNVFGLRPGIGTVPQEGSEQWIPNMGVLGPMARTVEDLALLLSVQAGFDRRSPLSHQVNTAELRGSLASDPRGLRIGWLGDWGGQVPHDPGVLEVCKAALKVFAAMGCEIEEVNPGIEVEPVWQATQVLRWWMVGQKLLPLVDAPGNRDRFGPQTLWETANARGLSAVKVSSASALRTAFVLAFERLFERYDYLVAPAAQIFPFPVEETWPTKVAGHEMRTYHEWMLGNFLITMTGLPSLAAPAGFGPNGLPAGIQIIGRNRDELGCLRIAHAYEQAIKPITERLPPSLL